VDHKLFLFPRGIVQLATKGNRQSADSLLQCVNNLGKCIRSCNLLSENCATPFADCLLSALDSSVFQKTAPVVKLLDAILKLDYCKAYRTGVGRFCTQCEQAPGDGNEPEAQPRVAAIDAPADTGTDVAAPVDNPVDIPAPAPAPVVPPTEGEYWGE